MCTLTIQSRISFEPAHTVTNNYKTRLKTKDFSFQFSQSYCSICDCFNRKFDKRFFPEFLYLKFRPWSCPSCHWSICSLLTWLTWCIRWCNFWDCNYVWKYSHINVEHSHPNGLLTQLLDCLQLVYTKCANFNASVYSLLANLLKLQNRCQASCFTMERKKSWVFCLQKKWSHWFVCKNDRLNRKALES